MAIRFKKTNDTDLERTASVRSALEIAERSDALEDTVVETLKER